jgi:hypothetical protein
MKNIARTLHTFALLALAALIGGQLGRLHWFAELFSHFLPYYAIAFLLATCLPHGKHWRWLWAGTALAVTVWLLQPFTLTTPDRPTQRLIWYNVHLDNPATARESATLLAEKADILALAEIDLDNPGWRLLRTHYPHGCQHQEDSPFALALWSAAPLAHCTIEYSGDFPYIRAVTTDGTTLYALHPPPPISSALAQARITYLHDTAARIAAEPRVLIIGDLNSSPYSPHYRDFLRTSGTIATTRYLTPTWRPLFLNLDHALVKGLEAATTPLPWQHSDHRALRVDYR